MTPDPPDDSFDKKIENLQAEVNDLAIKQQEAQRQFEARERKIARFLNLKARKERLIKEMNHESGEPSLSADPPEPDEPEDDDGP